MHSIPGSPDSEPSTTTTDCGTQFESRLFQALAQLIGAKKIHTIAYYPASNGMIERWHQTLKTAIICHNNRECLTCMFFFSTLGTAN